jgi:predicted amidohydrolase
MKIAAVAAHFGRDVGQCLTKIEMIVGAAASQDVDLLVFPDATIGGYLGTFAGTDETGLPPVLTEDSPELKRVAAAAATWSCASATGSSRPTCRTTRRCA